MPLQCVLHVSGDAKHSGDTVFPKQTWETAGIVAKARKSKKRSQYLDMYVNPIYTTVRIVFTMDVTVSLQLTQQSQEKVF